MNEPTLEMHLESLEADLIGKDSSIRKFQASSVMYSLHAGALQGFLELLKGDGNCICHVASHNGYQGTTHTKTCDKYVSDYHRYLTYMEEFNKEG